MKKLLKTLEFRRDKGERRSEITINIILLQKLPDI